MPENRPELLYKTIPTVRSVCTVGIWVHAVMKNIVAVIGWYKPRIVATGHAGMTNYRIG